MKSVSDFCLLTCSKYSAQATRPNASWYQTSRAHTAPCTSISSCWQGQTATGVIANSVSADIRPDTTNQLQITPCCHSVTAAELRLQMLKWQWSLWLNSEHVRKKCVTGLGFKNLIMISNWLNSGWPEHVVCPGIWWFIITVAMWQKRKKKSHHVFPLDLTKPKLCWHGICLKNNNLLSLVLGDTQILHCCALQLQ